MCQMFVGATLKIFAMFTWDILLLDSCLICLMSLSFSLLRLWVSPLNDRLRTTISCIFSSWVPGRRWAGFTQAGLSHECNIYQVSHRMNQRIKCMTADEPLRGVQTLNVMCRIRMNFYYQSTTSMNLFFEREKGISLREFFVFLPLSLMFCDSKDTKAKSDLKSFLAFFIVLMAYICESDY